MLLLLEGLIIVEIAGDVVDIGPLSWISVLLDSSKRIYEDIVDVVPVQMTVVPLETGGDISGFII